MDAWHSPTETAPSSTSSVPGGASRVRRRRPSVSFELSPTRYYELLNEALEDPEAMEYDPPRRAPPAAPARPPAPPAVRGPHAIERGRVDRPRRAPPRRRRWRRRAAGRGGHAPRRPADRCRRAARRACCSARASTPGSSPSTSNDPSDQVATGDDDGDSGDDDATTTTPTTAGITHDAAAVRVQVLNGGAVTGSAGAASDELIAGSYNVVEAEDYAPGSRARQHRLRRRRLRERRCRHRHRPRHHRPRCSRWRRRRRRRPPPTSTCS